MKTTKVGRAPIWLAILVAACNGGMEDVVAPTASRAEGRVATEEGRPLVELPFKARFTIRPQLLAPGQPGYPDRCPTGPGQFAAPATGEGVATHLGAFTDVESACIDLNDATFDLGEFVFTGAQGDALQGTYRGRIEGVPGTAKILADVEITGGTGRFEGATGTGVAVGQQQGDGTTVFEMEATLLVRAGA